MSKIWATLAGLALALPMGAYVAGSLAAADDDPSDRSPIQLEPSDDSTTPSPRPDRTQDTRTDQPTPKAPRTVTPQPDDLDDPGDDGGRDDGGRDDDGPDDPGDDDGDEDGGDEDGGDDDGDDGDDGDD